MTNPPSILEELDRKAIESADELSRGYAQGKVGSEGLAIGLRTLWQVTSGLVSNDISELLAGLANDAAKLPKEPLISVFVAKDTDAVMGIVSWRPGSVSIAIKTPGRTIERSFTMEADAKAAYAKACVGFGNLYRAVNL